MPIDALDRNCEGTIGLSQCIQAMSFTRRTLRTRCGASCADGVTEIPCDKQIAGARTVVAKPYKAWWHLKIVWLGHDRSG